MKQDRKINIVTVEDNERYLKMIEDLMNKGSDNLTENENEQLSEMSFAVQVFEQTYYSLRASKVPNQKGQH